MLRQFYRTFATINIEDLDKLRLLNHLWNNQVPASFFYFSKTPLPKWNEKEAQEKIKYWVNYIGGRQIGMDLSQKVVNSDEYDKTSKLKAQEIVDAIRKGELPRSLTPIEEINFHEKRYLELEKAEKQYGLPISRREKF